MTLVCSAAALVIGLMGASAPASGIEDSLRVGPLRAAATAPMLELDRMGPPRDRMRLAETGFERPAQTTRRDPVGDGAKKGAWIGGLTGLGTIALLSTRCAGGCDDPSVAEALPAATALGAGVGALIGLVADAMR